MILAEKILNFAKKIVSAFASFWEKLIGWLQNAIRKISEKIKKVVYGATVFAKRIGDKVKEISKHYAKAGTVWEEYVVTKEVSEDEVPDFIKANYRTDELDISNELENVLA